jgi:hypothetical protein
VHDILKAAPPLHLLETAEQQKKKLSSQCLEGKRRITLNSTYIQEVVVVVGLKLEQLQGTSMIIIIKLH